MSYSKSDRQKKKRNTNLALLTFDLLRVVPEPTKPEKNPYSDRLSDLLFVILIFGIAVWVRFWVRAILTGEYGNTFNIVINEDDTFGIGNYLGVQSGQQVQSEGYNDYEHYYIPYVNAFVDLKWNPYSGNIDEDIFPDGTVLNGYVYGPIYIYAISIGKAWFGLSAEESIIWSNIIFDSATYSMVYILAKRVTGNMIAMIISLLGSLSPIAIFYANIRVLNAPQMNFFVLVFIYFFLEHRDTISMFFLAAATLTKQFPLFLLMPVGFFMVRRYGFLKGVAIYLLYFVFILLLSVPWILLTPTAYITKLFLPGGGKDIISCPEGGEATNLVNAELDLESCDVYNSTKNYNDVEISEFGEFLFPLVNNHYIFFGALLLISLLGFSGYDYMEKNPKLYYRFFAAFFGIAHATIARGIYKYYLTFLIPLILLALIPGDVRHSLNLRIGAKLNRAWSTWINPKYRIGQVSKEYWIFFLILSLCTFGVIWFIDLTISLFTTTEGYHNVWLLILGSLALLFILKPGNIPKDDFQNREDVITYKRKESITLILIFSIIYGLKFIAEQYFENNSDALRDHMFIGLGFLLLFMYLPSIQNSVTKTNLIYPYVNFSYSQIILDLISIGIIFFVVNLFHVELLLIDRYFTTTIVLAFSIFILGLLGSEIWGSYFKFYVNVFNKFRRLYYRSLAN
ncbi:MAG: glycosyltransferase family 39 protein [Candidatus Heimdallarchaeota archaeon]|nr:glycosyltransferase family 39 protein [Candidatus Heimdallarchaeota archaeon]